MDLSDILVKHRKLTHPPVVHPSAPYLHSVPAPRHRPGYVRRSEVENRLVVGRGNHTPTENAGRGHLIHQSLDASSACGSKTHKPSDVVGAMQHTPFAPRSVGEPGYPQPRLLLGYRYERDSFRIYHRTIGGLTAPLRPRLGVPWRAMLVLSVVGNRKGCKRSAMMCPRSRMIRSCTGHFSAAPTSLFFPRGSLSFYLVHSSCMPQASRLLGCLRQS